MGAVSDKFTLVMVALFFTSLSYTEGVLKCFKCTTTKPPMHSNETVRLCSDFDYSEKFIVECPFSTYCMKRYYSAWIDTLINSTERDCAFQKYVTQIFKDGRWQPKIVTEDPYEEGCSTVKDNGLRTSKTIDCYCKGYLCNSSNMNISKSFPTLLAVITFVNKIFQ